MQKTYSNDYLETHATTELIHGWQGVGLGIHKQSMITWPKKSIYKHLRSGSRFEFGLTETPVHLTVLQKILKV